MSASRLIMEIQRRGRARKAEGKSDAFALRITTPGNSFRGPLLCLSVGDNFVEIGDSDESTLIVLDQITSVKPIWQ